jgi:Flp pilus assembly pilin Flp
MYGQMAALRRAEAGATVIEYALIAAIVSLSLLVVEQTIGIRLNNYFFTFANQF